MDRGISPVSSNTFEKLSNLFHCGLMYWIKKILKFYLDLKNSIMKFRERDTWYYIKVVLTLLIGSVAVIGIMLGDPNYLG